MDPISYGVAAKQKQRIEKVIAEPDSDSGIVTTPSTIAVGETITIPAGRTAVLPNTTVNGTLVVDGEVFIPSGSSYTATEVDVTVIKQNGNTVVDTMQNQLVGGVKTFSSFPITPNSAPTADYQVANKKYVDGNKGISLSTANTYDIGVGQTWQDVTASRTSGTTYTNSTGKPIFVVVESTTGGGGAQLTPIVRGVTLPAMGGASVNKAFISFIVQAGATYSVTTNLGTMTKWVEFK